MSDAPSIVSREAWTRARTALLADEKAFNAARDALSARRRDLPWVEVTEDYRFDSEDGPVSLGDLFGPHSQLIVDHFMFDPAWDDGCKACSLMADHLQGALPHLAARDVAFVAVSSAPVSKLSAFKARMGWDHRWVSAGATTFNQDFGVTFTPEEVAEERVTYNYKTGAGFGTEAPGLSVFTRRDGRIYHTYSTFARGLDLFINAYNLLDIVPKGRDEGELPWSMAWVRLHDTY